MNETIVLRLREGVGFDRLTETLQELVDLQGCPSCGLNGWDLQLMIDPRIRFEKFHEGFGDVLSGVDVFAGGVGRRGLR